MKRWNFNDLVRIMARLRGRRGCPWDRKQTHRSLLKYLREEAGEVTRAVKKNDYPNLREELGDLFLQIVFHAQLAKEKGLFDIHDVVDGLCQKLIRRHPHVFGGKKLRTAGEVMVQWKEMKRREGRSARVRGKEK